MLRDADLLPLLSRLGRTPVSGEVLAHALHLSRPAIWKQIRVLQNMGFPIRAVARKGYRLDGVADFSLKSLRFQAPLQVWAHPYYSLKTESTQKLARHAAQNSAPEGSLWIAELQTEGRGRLGRPWISGFGGLWFSLLLRPNVTPTRAASVGLMAALALAQTLETIPGLTPIVKWPNDVLVKGPAGWRKVAGFLTEMSGEADRVEWIVLGAGLNVFNRLPPTLAPIATTLSDVLEAGQPGNKVAGTMKRAQLLTSFLTHFWGRYRLWQREGFAPFRADYWSRFLFADAPVTLRTVEGDLTGLARSIDASGAIIIESRRKTHAIFEGEIVL